MTDIDAINARHVAAEACRAAFGHGPRDEDAAHADRAALLARVAELEAALAAERSVAQRFHDWRNASEDERLEDFFEHLVRLVRESDDEVNAARAATRAAEQSELKALRERDALIAAARSLRSSAATLADCVLDNCERPEGGAWYPNDEEAVALARRVVADGGDDG